MDHTTASTTLGHHLRLARLARGLSQEDLGVRAGVTTRAIGYIERGLVVAPRVATVVALAAALDHTPSWLLSSDPDALSGP